MKAALAIILIAAAVLSSAPEPADGTLLISPLCTPAYPGDPACQLTPPYRPTPTRASPLATPTPGGYRAPSGAGLRQLGFLYFFAWP